MDVFENSSLLEYIAFVDIHYTFEFLREWIINENYDEKKYIFYYPKLIYNTFSNHEKILLQFLNELVKTNDKRFDILLNYTIKKIIFELRLKLGSNLYLYNNADMRDLKKLILNDGLDTAYAKDLNDVILKIEISLDILNKYEISNDDAQYKSHEHLKNEINKRKQFFERKILLINRCLELLIQICRNRGIDSSNMTKGHNGKSIHTIITQIEILRDYIFTEKYNEKLDYEIIRSNFSFFQNFIKYFGYDWLQREYNKGHPYHPLLTSLSKVPNSEDFKQLLTDFESEKDETTKLIKHHNLLGVTGRITWLKHIEECIGFFSKENEQGKGIIINGLKDKANFYQFLSPLELGIKLKKNGYNVILEDTSIIKKPAIDILASKNNEKIIFELATFDTHSPLKYSGFESDIPDRAMTELRNKLRKQLVKLKDITDAPIIIVFNLSYSLDVDMHGICYALSGAPVEHIVMDEKGEIVKRFIIIERDSKFIQLDESKILSAVIFYRTENTYENIKFKGDIIINKSSNRMIKEDTVNDLKKTLFDGNLPIW